MTITPKWRFILKMGDMLASFISYLDKECFRLFAKQFEGYLQKRR